MRHPSDFNPGWFDAVGLNGVDTSGTDQDGMDGSPSGSQ
jgi:hypothetical protein